MGLKRFIFLSILFVGGVGFFFYTLDASDYTFKIAGAPVNLPIYVWVVVPTILFAVAAILHIIYHGLKSYFVSRGYEVDNENIKYFINDLMLGRTNNITFKTKEFKGLATILKQMNLTPNSDEFKSKSKLINSSASLINSINSGEAVAPKELKMLHTNPLYIKNLWNNLESNDKFALEVLKNAQKHPEDLVKEAFIRFIKVSSKKDIKKFLDVVAIDKDVACELFKRDRAEGSDFELNSQEIAKLAQKAEFDKNDYLLLIQSYKTRLDPDSTVKLAEDLSNLDENAQEAYVYILMDFEMLDTAREIVLVSGPDEYLPYKALLDLRDAGKHYTFDMLCLGGKAMIVENSEEKEEESEDSIELKKEEETIESKES
jgi:hypothetical protein